MTVNLSSTMAYEALRADGGRVLAEALCKAGKGDAGADLAGITEMLLNDAIKIIAADRGERDFETIKGLAANIEDSISNFQESLLSSMPDNRKKSIHLKH